MDTRGSGGHAVVRVTIYVEGGGRGKDQRPRCREAFSKLFAKAGFRGRMPRVLPGGSRNSTYDDFLTSIRDSKDSHFPVLLVDSEDPVGGPPWDHVRKRDGWERPAGAEDDQAQLMVTCMETWIIADREALRRVFGSELQLSALPPTNNLESRSRGMVQDSLERATAPCGRRREYRKGRRSFQALSEVNPEALTACLPHFRRLIECIERRMRPNPR